ncbi:hypothetical protein DFH07DRAFT_782450 [Mycena maculata]|uniref:Bulb-type lectin domain-containing protein n=1 Tax=Mycena maculata TaxID=230809 RepID=A0AAD7HT10_9AGAR|nr:hypothetical protein DFH07DRAFT_782450 [Mycena maculata]
MSKLTQLFTLALCALSTIDDDCRHLLHSQDGTPSNLANPMDLVNAGFNGSAFALLAGDILVQKGNTDHNVLGIWEKQALDEDLYAIKNHQTGWYVVSAGEDVLRVAAAAPPTVFAIDSADTNTYIIKEPDSGLVWEAVDSGEDIGKREQYPALDVGGSILRYEKPCSAASIWRKKRLRRMKQRSKPVLI